MTKTEARKLAQRARRLYATYPIDATRIEIACPLDAERYRTRLAHRITVWHKPWEKVSAAMIDAAFIEHYCSPYEDERCGALT